jgi:GT2 family glycosyltransferase
VTDGVPIAVIVPTAEGRSINSLLAKIRSCDPQPAEIWVHMDLADGAVPDQNQIGPNVKVLTSATQLGPGGGRHRCLLACSTPYAVSFDDDSYPVDSDFFDRARQLLSEHPRAAIIGATIWHRHEPEKSRIERLILKPTYVGCGYAIRLAAYRQVRGYLPIPIAYGMEESDLALQLFAADWRIYEAGDLRVLHDTDLDHHNSAEITSGVITNVGLYVFLNYPFIGWGRGVAQVANKVAYCIKMGRLRGICSGILRIPVTCYHYRRYRNPVSWKTLRKFLRFHRAAARVIPG